MTDPGAVARAEVIVARDRAEVAGELYREAEAVGDRYREACAALDRAERAFAATPTPLAIPTVPKPVAVPSRPDLPHSTWKAMNEAHDETWRVCCATDNPWATMLDARDAARRKLNVREAAK